MENKITTPNQNVNTQFMFKNEELNKFSAQIAVFNGNINSSLEAHTINVSNNLCQIAYIMAQIDSKELYKDDGFKSAAEYAMETFDYKKSQAFNLVRVGKIYGERLLNTQFKFTQLVEALPMGAEKFDELVAEHIIVPEDTASEIREIAKQNKAKERKPAKVKEFYFELLGYEGQNTVGPMTESAFMESGDIYKLKRKNGDIVYVDIMESGKAGIWKAVEATNVENKGE